MANRFWVGGTATWDGTAGTKWATTSGGAGGAAVPTAADDVFFDAASGAVVCTTSASSICRSLDCTGYTGTLTLANSGTALRIGDASGGAMKLVAGMTFGGAGSLAAVVFISTADNGGVGWPITTAGKSVPAVFDGAGGKWQLQDALSGGNNSGISITAGHLDTNSQAVSANLSTFSAGGTLTMGSTVWSVSLTNGLVISNGFTLNAGTGTFRFTANSTAAITFTNSANGTITFNDIEFPNGSPVNLTGVINCADFTYVAGARTAERITFATASSSLTCSGTLTVHGQQSPNRAFIVGTLGVGNTVTAATVVSNGYVDWQDITAAGAAAPFTPSSTQPSYRSYATATNSAIGTLDPGFPAGYASTDLLLAHCENQASGSLVTAPSGWTSFAAKRTTSGGSAMQAQMFWARPDQVTSTAFSTLAAVNNRVTIIAVQDWAFGATPTLADGGSGAAGTTVTIPSISTLIKDVYLDMAFAGLRAASSDVTTWNGGFTEAFDIDSGTAPELAVGQVQRSDGTSGGSTTATQSASDSWIAHRVNVPGASVFGDGGGCTNITFPVSTTKYLCGAAPTWSQSVGWSTTATGTPGNAVRGPLPHDDVLMGTGGNAVSGSITMDRGPWGRDVDFTNYTPPTNTVSFTNTAQFPQVFGSLTMTTGMYGSGMSTIGFFTRTDVTITSNGFYWGGSTLTLNQAAAFNGPGGSFTLADDWYTGVYSVTLNAGRLKLGSATLTTPAFQEGTGTLAKGIDFETGTIEVHHVSIPFRINSTNNETDTADPGSRILVAVPDGVVKDGGFQPGRENRGDQAAWWRTNWQSSLDATTQLDVRVRVTLNHGANMTPWSSCTLASRWVNTLRSWAFLIDSNGTLRANLSPNGTSSNAMNSSVTMQSVYGNSMPQTKWLRFTWRSSDGRLQFLVADGSLSNPAGGDWVQLGTDRTLHNGTPISANPSFIEILASDGVTDSAAFRGKTGGNLSYFDLRTAIDGSPVAVLDFRSMDDFSMSAADGLGNEWFTVFAHTNTIARIIGRRLSMALSSNFVSTPDTPALDITGDIDLRAHATLNSWASGAGQSLICKWNTTGNQQSYDLQVTGTGNLQLRLSANGSAVTTATSSATLGSVSVAARQTKWVRATWRQSDGRVQFFYSDDGASWTQLGTDQSAVIASIFSSSANLSVGCQAAGIAFPVSGQVWYADVRSGIDGSPVAIFDPSILEDLARTWTDSTGKVWTLTRSSVPTAQNIFFDQTSTETLPDLKLEIEPGGQHSVTFPANGGNAVVGELECLGPRDGIHFATNNTITAGTWSIQGTYSSGGRTPRTRLRSTTTGTKSARQVITTLAAIANVDIQDVWIRGPFETFSGLGSTPPSLAALATMEIGAWASDPAWTPPADGSPVSSWRDYSGGGNPFTQGTGAQQPIYDADGLNGTAPALVFDGSDDQVISGAVAADASPISVVVVVQDDNVSPATQRWITGTLDVGVYREFSTWRMAGNIVVNSGVTIDASPHILTANLHSSGAWMHLDGTRVSGLANAGATGLAAATVAIGSRNSGNHDYDGKIALVFWFDAFVAGDTEAYYDFVKWVSSFYDFPVVDLVTASGSVNNGNNEGWRYSAPNILEMTAALIHAVPATPVLDAKALIAAIPSVIDVMPAAASLVGRAAIGVSPTVINVLGTTYVCSAGTVIAATPPEIDVDPATLTLDGEVGVGFVPSVLAVSPATAAVSAPAVMGVTPLEIDILANALTTVAAATIAVEPSEIDVEPGDLSLGASASLRPDPLVVRALPSSVATAAHAALSQTPVEIDVELTTGALSATTRIAGVPATIRLAPPSPVTVAPSVVGLDVLLVHVDPTGIQRILEGSFAVLPVELESALRERAMRLELKERRLVITIREVDQQASLVERVVDVEARERGQDVEFDDAATLLRRRNS